MNSEVLGGTRSAVMAGDYRTSARVRRGRGRHREMPGQTLQWGQTRGMRTPSRDHTRAERLREHAAILSRARCTVGAMGQLVRGREARARDPDVPLEVQFALVEVDGRALPAAVWVALRRDDVDAAIDTMTSASQARFVIEEREVVGDGYRLESVQDTLPLPETELLAAQLSRAMDVPLDVLTVIAEWGPDDPRTTSEIEDLLTTRFGAVDPRQAHTTTIAAQPPDHPAPVQANIRPTMTVADLAQVLRLDDEQVRALAILVRNAMLTLVME
jgi:hypothetical protein